MPFVPPPPPLVLPAPAFAVGDRVRCVDGWKKGRVGTVRDLWGPDHIDKRCDHGRPVHGYLVVVEFAAASVPEAKWHRRDLNHTLRAVLAPDQLEAVR